MAQTQRSEATEVVRRRLSEIHAWQAQHLTQREIAKRLGLARSTYQDALKQVEAEKVKANETLQDDEGVPDTNALAKVYEGIHISTSETSLAMPEDLAPFIPALQELQDILPVLRTMAKQWSEQQSLAQIPEQYQKFNETYSVRLSGPLIEAIKAYAQRHRLTQSQLITAGVLRIISDE
jgi:transcriptional regulator with XRE-family HTH domain